MYDTILVPTDGSDHAERAARHACALAEAFDATVRVLAVADVSGAAGPFDAGGVSEEFVDRIEAESDRAVAAASALAPDEVAVESAVVEGRPAETILSAVEEQGVDLVAMGSRGRGRLRRFLAGSTADEVVRESPVPVVTVRETDEEPVTDYERVVIPTDGSSPSAAAVEHGVAVAAAFEATVHAVNVVDLGVVAGGSDVAAPAGLLENLVERGEAATERVAERARGSGVDAVTEVREGFPASDLLDYVDEEGIDFVAMGTHGRSGFDRVLLGSTTQGLIRQSPVPVMSVRAEQDGSAG